MKLFDDLGGHQSQWRSRRRGQWRFHGGRRVGGRCHGACGGSVSRSDNGGLPARGPVEGGARSALRCRLSSGLNLRGISHRRRGGSLPSSLGNFLDVGWGSCWCLSISGLRRGLLRYLPRVRRGLSRLGRLRGRRRKRVSGLLKASHHGTSGMID